MAGDPEGPHGPALYFADADGRWLDAPPPCADVLASAVARVAAGGSVEHVERREWRATVRRAPGGGVAVAVAGVSSSDSLERNLVRYDRILRATREMVWDWDIVANEAWWSDRAYDLLACDPPTIPSFELWAQRLHPDDRERVIATFQDVIASRATTWTDEYRFALPDGRVVAIEDHGWVERGPDGKPVRMIGIARDVTERRIAEHALRESEERLRQIFDTIDAVFWMNDAAGTELLYVSPACERLWGLTVEELKRDRDTFMQAILEEDRHLLTDRIARHLTGEYDVTYRIHRPDGTIAWIRDRAFPVYDANGKIVRIAGLATDITQLRRLEEQLAHVQKMESVGRLAGGIAHDFNNLLTAILTSVELVVRQLPAAAPTRVRDDLEQIRRAGQRAADLTGQLLAFARKQVIAPTTLDLGAVVVDLEQLLRRVIGEHIELVTIAAPDLGAVVADRGQLEQVLVNLAVNARDAMPGGGRLVIECANHAVKRRVVDSHADVEPGDYVMIAVRDQGPGITDDVRPHLFEPFFTTKPAGRGTGLGLATCYGIVRQAGGHIFVDSEPGQGATFKVLLPRVAAAVDAPPVRVRSLPVGGAETVLFVEDDAMVRRVAVRVLGDAGYRVIAAVDGMDGLRRSMEHAGTIDLVVTDIVMPGLDGPELARRLREARPDVKIVFTSGYAEGALRLSEDVPVRFLPKPYVIESLLAYVRAALDA